MEDTLKNSKTHDNGAKLIFDDPILCAQFLRGYTNIDILKDVQPEDIEDISERFLPMWQEGRDSDSVKKVQLKDYALFLIAIVEHQSNVYYDMAFKILRYIVMVWTDYEGHGEWTAVRNFNERVYLQDILRKYIPNFEYVLVPLRDYSQQDLIEKKDELSLILLINKLRDSEDFKTLKDIPQDYFEDLEQKTPDYLLALISKIVAVFLYRLNVPRREVESFTDQIKRREFDMLFDSFEAYDVQETRRVSREEGKTEGKIEGKIEAVLDILSNIATVPPTLQEKIQAVTDLDKLTSLLKLAAKVHSIEEFETTAKL